MKRLLLGWAWLFGAVSVASASALLPGSIDFNTSGLWGKTVRYGLDDQGGYEGATRWYSDDGSTAVIQRYTGRGAGYLRMASDGVMHRAIQEIHSSTGPTANEGQEIPASGLFVDSKVTVTAHVDWEVRVESARDKINCWLYQPEDGSATNFIITAGVWDENMKTLTATNYVTDAQVVEGTEFQLTIRALPNVLPNSQIGFEVYVNGELVRCGEQTVFPSMVKVENAFGATLYSFGVSGLTSVDKINFTRTNPMLDPEYDQDDISMLRESAEITITGFPKTESALLEFPMLVRISESRINGFHYSRTASDGSDIRFTDENGKVIPCEIDTWNPSGESLVWVKVPLFRYGGKIRMHWALRHGATAPANSATAVWSEYAAVWHFSSASAGYATDSSGNGMRAKIDDTATLLQPIAATKSPIGMAGYVEGTNGSLVATWNYERFAEEGNFTFTGWYVGRECFGTNATEKTEPLLGTKYETDAGIEASDAHGWCGRFNSFQRFQFIPSSEAVADYSVSSLSPLTNNWFHLAYAVTGNATADLYLNGAAAFTQVPFVIQPTERPFQVMRHGMCGDEVRIAKVARSAAWIKAEYDQAQVSGYLTYGTANTKGRDNYWVREPSVTPDAVAVEEARTIVIDAGQPRYGIAYVQLYDEAGNRLEEVPTTVGTYKAVTTVDPGIRDGLQFEKTFVIFSTRAYRQLAGHDRVMLFNSDESPLCPVTLQGYYDVDSLTNSVWYHDGSAWQGAGSFVLPGANHVYMEPETGRELWTFRHARLGNLFQSDTGLTERMNFLPWGGYADRFDDSERLANAQRYAGTLILQNVADDANPPAAYSPMYEDGIGTIYFDAVNAYCDYKNKLKVEVCGTEGADVAEGEWREVAMEVFAVRNGVYDEATSTSGVTEATLAMSKTEGSTNWFYRVRACVNANTPIRFRIVRTDESWSEGSGPDDAGLVLIDNIVASYPAMGVSISQYGASEVTNDLYLAGQRAPFDIAFPSADDLGSIHAYVKVRYVANNTNEVDTSFVGAMTMNYRWRYLDQALTDWKEIALFADPSEPTRFVSKDALDGDGIGDLEYNVKAVVNAPYYEYWDYSGLNLSWPDGYSERRGDVAISAEQDGVYDETHRSAAFGTDYFVRLRDGRSNYEGFRLHLRANGSTTETVVPMQLFSDHTWRGFYSVPSIGLQKVSYRLEGYNRQDQTGVDYQWTTNWFCGVNKKEIPVSDVVEESEGWATISADGLDVTGYLLFQVEDETKALSVIRANYQNFNIWTDAYSTKENPYFSGTSEDYSKTSGVSRTARSYSETFERLNASVATNRFWVENFEAEASEEGEYAVEVPFTGTRQTPYGWTAQNGTWVCKNYREIAEGKYISLKMKGEGYGSLLFPQSEDLRGIESFSYRARLAQSFDIHSFNFYVGTTNDVYNRKDYTFAVPCTMIPSPTDPDFTGLGSVSAVAYYRESSGGYEARVERIAKDKIRLCLYKWLADGSVKELGHSSSYNYADCGFSAGTGQFGAIVISCTNTTTNVYITAGVTAARQTVNKQMVLSGEKYLKVAYADDADDRHLCGTFGLASRDCPAVFALPKWSQVPIAWNVKDGTKSEDGKFWYWPSDKPQALDFKTAKLPERAVIGSAEEYKDWNVYQQRMVTNDYTYVKGGVTNYIYGFKATVPTQLVLLETSPHLQNVWSIAATNQISSFAYTNVINRLYASDNLDLRLRTGPSSVADIVISQAEARQWRGESYDDSNNMGNYGGSSQVAYGAATNFVFTTAWVVGDGSLEVSAMRTTADRPSGLRSPLMDGLNDRGLGLGAFSYSYRDADARARLIIQIATNSVSRGSLHDLTANVNGWVDVATNDFSKMTVDERKSGTISCYLGLHGVTGVMRVIVDPALVEEAHDPAFNRDNDPSCGRVYLTMATAKDNPVLDSGSWWGWNLRITDDPEKWLLEDGSPDDARRHGQSFALNNSIDNDVLPTDVYNIHKPFLQTPIFTKGVVGEVTFKARKYSASDPSPSVAIYGMKDYDPSAKDEKFTFLTNILITSERFATYTYQAPVSDNYSAFRLAVTGVGGIIGDGSSYTIQDPPAGPSPEGYVERVLLDEVAIYEAIRARLGFRNVGAFRSRLGDTMTITHFPSKSEQPICKEAWGVQAELYMAQLADKVDLTPGREPRVLLHWFEGTSPWGFENWRSESGAKHAWLARTSDSENLIYRSSYLDAPTAVIDPVQTPGTIMQYSLQVVFYMTGQDVAMTNTLESGDWVKPDWYNPIDCNEEYGANMSFSAYNILDSVAPGWAWINEINLFGEYDNDFNNTDSEYQFLEIAAPSEADLTDWKVRMLLPDTGSLEVYTNTVATFGIDNLDGTKPDLLGQASGMVFRVIASRPSSKTGKLKRKDGTLDGVWSFDNPDGSVFSPTGQILEDTPFGIQLVRPSGIVEHEIVVMGTNYWGSLSRYGDQYHPSNTVNFLNRYMKNANFFHAGDDNGGAAKALAVYDSRGEAQNYWDNMMIHTPGRINEYADGTPQVLSPEHPTPYGTSIFIYANLGSGGHIVQTCGDAEESAVSQILVIQRGSLVGTDITYKVDRWYELGEVTTNGAPMEPSAPVMPLVYRVTVGKGASNDITVVANAQPCSKLREFGVDESNRYTPAIMDWFNHQTDMYGNNWPDDGTDAIYLAKYLPYRRGPEAAEEMTLTEMYWLDMCPTISNQYLIAGFSKPPLPIIRLDPDYEADTSLTNRQMSVYMAISNALQSTESKPLVSPYVIRGVDPGSSSWDYALPTAGYAWTNASFKITGILANGQTSESNKYNWVALRWFVFNKDSFYQPDDLDPIKAAKAYTTEIEIVDPYSPESPGYQAGWGEWIKRAGWTPNVYHRWSIDERMRPIAVEILKPNNYYSD